jgi:hypothetical protein
MIEDLKNIKKLVNQLNTTVKTLPEGVIDEARDSLNLVKEEIDKTIFLIENHFATVAELERIKEDLKARMTTDGIHQKVLTEPEKDAVAERIIDNPKIELLTKNTLSEYIVATLRRMNGEDLATKAFGKDRIVEIGENIVGQQAPSTSKYQTGLDAVMKSLESPSGREEAITFGQNRIQNNTELMKKYLLNYYGL